MPIVDRQLTHSENRVKIFTMNSIKNFEIAEMINKLELFKNKEAKNAVKLRYLMVINILTCLLKMNLKET